MRKYDKEFKAEMARRMVGGQSVSSLSRETGISVNVLHKWKQLAMSELPEADSEVLKLRKRLREVEMENEILKKAALIFGRGS